MNTIPDDHLPEELAPAKSAYDTGYETGQDNVEFLGLDMHNPVFFISAAAILIFAAATLAFPTHAAEAFASARNWTLSAFDWLFVITTNIALVFCIAIAISPLGRVRLGGEDARPEFGLLSWLAMLFSAGVGIGMVFYGAAEPLAYYSSWSGTPLNAEAFTEEARRLAFSATLFHWGLTPWAVYGTIGLALAFFTFNKGLPLTMRSAFYPLLGDRIWGAPGHLIDASAVVATLFGLATSLGLGAKQAASGVGFLVGIEAGLTLEVVLICAITAAAIYSVIRGLDGGVRLLSNINIVLALALLVFIIAVGPKTAIFTSIKASLSGYAVDFVPLSKWFGRQDLEWFHSWTVFYWAWWISWSPFVGMFIARVSRGRTVREFLSAVLVVPFFAATVWFSAFGATAIDQASNNVGELSDGISDVSIVLFQMLDMLPYSTLSSVVAIFLLFVFFVTSSDSGSLVIDSITAGGKLNAPVVQRIFWATMEGLVAIVLLVGGGSAALSSLQAGTIATGLPFSIILIACCMSLYIGLRSEVRT